MTSSRRLPNGVLPALFAMLLLIAGPLLSQAVSLSHASPQPAPCHAQTPVHAHGEPAASTALHGDGHAHALWAKCGYCELLLTCPGVSGFGYVALVPPPYGRPQALLCKVRDERLPPVLHDAQPRAPPVLV